MKLPDSVNKIIVFRALQLGDMLCVIPAIRALRKHYPRASITLVGLPWASAFVERFAAYFDAFIEFPGYPGLPEQPLNPSAFTKFLTDVQNQHFDLALQMQGNGYLVNPMVELFGAKYTAGFCKPGDYTPNDNYFMIYPDYGSEIERHLKLMNFLGIRATDNELEFPITSTDQADFERAALELAPKRYVCIHPGSRGAWRQWPVEYFAAIADHLAEHGYDIVITGTNNELHIVENVINNMRHTPINTAGKTNLGTIAVMIKNSALLVSNCTGVSHIAAAFKTPSIVISMDGEPERWGPLNKHIHRTINWLKDPGYEFVLGETDALFHQLDEA